jgi:hypothetical protein
VCLGTSCIGFEVETHGGRTTHIDGRRVGSAGNDKTQLGIKLDKAIRQEARRLMPGIRIAVVPQARGKTSILLWP